jgi:putative NADH-flavin reductase
MKIVVFGASGATGRCIIDKAKARGQTVTAVIRAGATVENATVIEADVLDAEAVSRAVAGHDAIVSALGHRRAARWPYARLLSPIDLLARATTNFIAAARAHNINRVFVVSLHAAGDSLARTSSLYRFLCTRTQIRHATHDSNVMESLLAASKLDWLAARPVTLTNGDGNGTWKIRTDRIGSFATISRADVAAFLVAELDKSGRSERTPSLSS